MVHSNIQVPILLCFWMVQGCKCLCTNLISRKLSKHHCGYYFPYCSLQFAVLSIGPLPNLFLFFIYFWNHFLIPLLLFYIASVFVLSFNFCNCKGQWMIKLVNLKWMGLFEIKLIQWNEKENILLELLNNFPYKMWWIVKLNGLK